MLLDASVIVAALAEEREAESIKLAMLNADRLGTSPLAVFEASCRIAKLREMPIDQAFSIVEAFLADAEVLEYPIDSAVGVAAHACASRYHHLTRHPARLNMGDCFAYAAARSAGLKLAYKGDDFVHTDIEGIRFGPDRASK